MYPNKDNIINRDDDAKRSPLSAKHVADFVFQGNQSAAIDDRSYSSFSGGIGGGDRILSGWVFQKLIERKEPYPILYHLGLHDIGPDYVATKANARSIFNYKWHL